MRARLTLMLIAAAVAAGTALLVTTIAAERVAREVAERQTTATIDANGERIREHAGRLERLGAQLTDLRAELENPNLPVGVLLPYTGPLDAAARERLESMGWLPARGQVLQREAYPLLAERLGEAFGTTENLEAFRLPDLRGRVPVGSGSYDDPVSGPTSRTLGQKLGSADHQLSVNELPEHTHALKVQSARDQLEGSYPVHRYVGRGNGEAESERTGKNAPHNNMPPSLVTHYLIRFR